MVFRAVGRVIGTAMQKTAKVAVTRTVQHPKYEKHIRLTKKYLCHDEEQICTVGDLVRIEECRPISKRKAFTVKEIVQPVKKYTDEQGRVFTPVD